MNQSADCEDVRPLLAELATGASTGHERAGVLRHLMSCVDCRRDLTELARVADELLLAAPRREPPPGFETTVVNRIMALAAAPLPGRHPVLPPRQRSLGVAAPRRRRTDALMRGLRDVVRRRPALRPAMAALALLAAAGAGAGATYWQGGADRQLAARYQETIGVPVSQFPTAVAITSGTGAVVGHVFFYQGSPAWVTVALSAAPASGDYAMSVVAKDGRRYPEGVCTVTGRTGISGYPLPVDIADVAAIDLTRPGIQLTVHP